MFELFDPNYDFRVKAGNLPHWYQPGVTYFVTFRMEDSLPKSVADSWYQRRNDWLYRHGIDPSGDGWKRRLEELPYKQQVEFDRVFSEEFHRNLDKGYGKCVLRDPALAQLVAESLLHFDGARYYMGDFIIMPNHVHLITCLIGDTEIEKQCYSWKKFTARKINEALGETGRFWQEESFDRLVRNPNEYAAKQLYIRTNGSDAGLSESEYLYHERTQ